MPIPPGETETETAPAPGPAAVDRAPVDHPPVDGTVYRTPWDDGLPGGATTARGAAIDPAPPAPPGSVRPRGRRPATARAATGEKPVWLYHHLTVSGPAETLQEFAAAARGAGDIPWRFDGDRFEEDVFHRAATVPAAQRGLSIDGCHILARQFRMLVEAHQARAAARVGHAKDCPFDLHALLPVPADILALGATHPDALAWLRESWGVTDRLRQVILRTGATAGRRLPRGHAAVGYGFFTAGETPHRAIATLAARFPALRFALLPRPAD
ncbi:MAG TPA: hypothetical protein VMU82_14155 [Acetobacteraceae bacterium]|nr:hypothetical protein [Acetobacteraceae bacterium]